MFAPQVCTGFVHAVHRSIAMARAPPVPRVEETSARRPIRLRSGSEIVDEMGNVVSGGLSSTGRLKLAKPLLSWTSTGAMVKGGKPPYALNVVGADP